MKLTSLIVLVSFVAQIASHAADLNAPGEKRVTVGSEIARAGSAVFQMLLQPQVMSGVKLLESDAAFSHLLSTNKEKNTDTDGFILGARFRYWLEMDRVLRSPDIASLNGPEATKSAVEYAEYNFKEVRKKQKEMGIEDKTLCDAAEQKYEAVAPIIQAWSRKIGEQPKQ